MWFEDPARGARRKLAAPYRVRYRVAAWSRIDWPAFGTVAMFWAVLFVPFAFAGERHIGLGEFALVCLALVLPLVALMYRLADLVRIDERGVSAVRGRGSRSPSTVVVPLSHVAGIEVRDWYRSYEAAAAPGRRRRFGALSRPTRTICARLIDGAYLELYSRDHHSSRPVLLAKRSRSPFWRPVHGPQGRWLVWTAAADQSVADLLMRDVERVRGVLGITLAEPGGAAAVPSAPYRFRLDVHRRLPPTRLSERDWYTASVSGDDPPIPDPAPEPMPPPPPTLPTLPAGRDALADSRPSTPAAFLDGLTFPTRYWTLASLRAGSLLGRRSSMLISTREIVFDRRWQRDLHIAISDADRFDIEFDAVTHPAPNTDRRWEGNWRLMLVLRDGTHLPLSGLDHGYFKQNRLFWATGKAANRLGEATGSMPWPNDQPLLVAARLNAHLAAARGPAQSSA